MKKNKLDELKIVELDILKQFIKVCDKLKINYFLAGGTLIGAVRHKGFIPWDDDIDVCMLREDYDKFIKEAQKHLPKNYFLQTYETDKNYLNCFSKIRNSDTTFIETSVNSIDMNHGIYIDIFPLDNLYKINSLKEKLIHFKLYEHYYSNSKKLTHKLFLLLSKIIYRRKSKLQLCKLKDKIYKQKNNSKTEKIVCYSGAWGLKKESHLKEDFEDFTIVDFEGIKVKAPIGYDRVLRDTYGDYMKLPPKEKRIAHHYADVIDTKKSYLEYMK